MNVAFVDTNVFLRFILKDVTPQYIKAKKIFEDAADLRLKLYSSVVVVFEIYWVLKSSYGQDGTELMMTLQKILKLSVEFENHSVLVEAVSKMAEYNFDLEDSYNLVYAKKVGVDKFETFDKKLLKKFVV